MFVHHPDGLIFINGEIIDTARNFTANTGYTLEENAVGRVYKPGVNHYLILEGNKTVPLPIEWADGDKFIYQAERYKRRISRSKIRRSLNITRKGSLCRRTSWQRPMGSRLSAIRF